MLSGLETWLAREFKTLPNLSQDTKKSIVDVWPSVAIIFGVLQLLAAISLWHTGHEALHLINTVSRLYVNPTTAVIHLNAAYWVSLVALVIDGLVLLTAFPQLRWHAKGGWNMLFYGTLIYFVYSICAVFDNYGSI